MWFVENIFNFSLSWWGCLCWQGAYRKKSWKCGFWAVWKLFKVVVVFFKAEIYISTFWFWLAQARHTGTWGQSFSIRTLFVFFYNLWLWSITVANSDTDCKIVFAGQALWVNCAPFRETYASLSWLLRCHFRTALHLWVWPCAHCPVVDVCVCGGG